MDRSALTRGQNNKLLKKKPGIPSWIRKKLLYKKAFIRGLFDTDGCVYVDKHKHNDKLYNYLCWTITSASPPLLNDVYNILKELGYSPTHKKTQQAVYLRKQSEIKRYFFQIKTNNPKHQSRYTIGRGRIVV